MTDTDKNPFACDLSNLTPRGVAIYEFLIGYQIQRAFVERRKQPRRTIPPLFAALHGLAARLDEQFDSILGKQFTVEFELKSPVGAVAKGLGFAVPGDWQSIYEDSAYRLLGQRFLQQTAAAKEGAKGKKRKRNEWSDRIAAVAANLARPNDPGDTLTDLQERVHEELCRFTDAGAYENWDSAKTPVAPSLKIVAARLRELGYRRGRYPAT
jgi:hypothetical protein